ncbi:hypothetical protein HKX48_002388 [Thoreauomyces humboldtii]|nr:hypothetical protein HKX48_002388 [Thoreauomyces humboldtii]
MSQVIVNLFAGLPPLCLQFPAEPLSGPLRASHLKNRLSVLFPLLPHEQRITTAGGQLVADDTLLFDVTRCGESVGNFPPVFNLLVRVPGGKGGFGSMLRAQGGKMASQKTTNFEACRDLSGRRLKTVNDAKKLADYLEKEPERKRKRQEENIEKLEKALKGPEKQKIRFHDPDYEQNHADVMEDVQDAVEKALRDVPIANAIKKKTPSPPATTVSSVFAKWDALSDDEEDSEEEEESDEEPSPELKDKFPAATSSGSGEESAQEGSDVGNGDEDEQDSESGSSADASEESGKDGIWAEEAPAGGATDTPRGKGILERARGLLRSVAGRE